LVTNPRVFGGSAVRDPPAWSGDPVDLPPLPGIGWPGAPIGHQPRVRGL